MEAFARVQQTGTWPAIATLLLYYVAQDNGAPTVDYRAFTADDIEAIRADAEKLATEIEHLNWDIKMHARAIGAPSAPENPIEPSIPPAFVYGFAWLPEVLMGYAETLRHWRPSSQVSKAKAWQVDIEFWIAWASTLLFSSTPHQDLAILLEAIQASCGLAKPVAAADIESAITSFTRIHPELMGRIKTLAAREAVEIICNAELLWQFVTAGTHAKYLQ